MRCSVLKLRENCTEFIISLGCTKFVKLIFYVTSLSIFLLCLWKGSLMLGFSLNWVDWVNIRLTQYINFYVVLSLFFKFDWAEGGLTFAINLQTLCASAHQPENDPSLEEKRWLAHIFHSWILEISQHDDVLLLCHPSWSIDLTMNRQCLQRGRYLSSIKVLWLDMLVWGNVFIC